MALFVAWQWVLIGSTSGTGSWAGMTVFFASLVVVPALAVADLWVLAPRWRGHWRAFGAGLLLPAAVGAIEAWMMFGGQRSLRPLGAVIESPYLPLVAIAFFAPLFAAVVHAVARRRRERAAGQSSSPVSLR